TRLSELTDAQEQELAFDTHELRRKLKQTVQDMVDAGVILRRWREVLPRGRFTSWLEGEVGLTYTTARRFILVADRFHARASTVEALPAGTVYLLAEPST